MLNDLVTLFFLVLLQAVLGFDNLLYISIESKRAPAEQQAMVRKWGIGLAVVLRIGLLFVLLRLVEAVREPFLHLPFEGVLEGEFNLHALVVLLGGAFILYTAIKEITHMMRLEEADEEDTEPRSAAAAIAWIVGMNLVFSFDSILSAMALTRVFWVMATAIVLGGLLMIWLSDRVASFLERNRMYEVLGLFVLFVVGVMLVSEGGHLAHVRLWGHAVTPMSKTTFYFVIGVLLLTEVVQGRYQRKLLARRRSAGTTSQG